MKDLCWVFSPEGFIILDSTLRFLIHFALILEVVLGKDLEWFLDMWTFNFSWAIYLNTAHYLFVFLEPLLKSYD